MADIRLKVSPEELKRGAAQIESQIANIEKNWNSLSEIAGASRYYWEGEAADYGRKLLEETRQDVQIVWKRLKEHPSNLLKMAGIYVEAEAKAAEIVNTLPDNAIF